MSTAYPQLAYGAPPPGRAVAATIASTGVTAATAAAAGGTVAGAGAVAGILTAAGISVSVPVAGWIVAGGLLVTAGIVAIVSKYANQGRRAAMAQAEALGEGGKAFAREFADNADKSTEKLQKRRASLLSRIAAKRAADGPLGVLRDKRIRQLVDRANATTVLLAMREAQVQAPAIAAEPATIPAAAPALESQEAPDMTTLALVGAGVLGVLGIAAALRS